MPWDEEEIDEKRHLYACRDCGYAGLGEGETVFEKRAVYYYDLKGHVTSTVEIMARVCGDKGFCLERQYNR